MKNNKINLSNLSRNELEKEYIKMKTELESAKAKVEWYRQQYELSKQARFGKSSEKNIAGQIEFEDLMLFNEAEALREPINIEPNVESLITKSHKKNNKRKDLKDLPVVKSIYELSKDEQSCEKCGAPLHEMKEEIRVEIEVIPAKVQIHKHISKVYACRNCEKNGESNIVKAFGAPKPVIEKSVASASLIADFLSKKYELATPFYRLEKVYERENIPVTRNNMCNWSIKVANDYYKPIIERMKSDLFSEHVIHCDETHVEVLCEEGRPASRKSYVWVMTSPKFIKDKRIALYNYTEGRSSTDARHVLKDYSGYIMCDGYAGYDALTKTGKSGEAAMDVTPVACMVHVRRKFSDALKLINPKERSGTSAELAIKKIANIFHIDNRFDDLAPEERKIMRQKELTPALFDFFAWVKSEYELALPKSKYGQAIEYAMNQEKKVLRVLDDGRLELDNNLAEQTVKPFVIGRKNWLFSNTPGGADASCVIYSIVESAKQNGLIPFAYMKYLLETMPGMPLTDENIEKLLPYSTELPKYLKEPSKS